MVKIRLIFIKRFAFRRKGRNKQVLFRNEIDQKNILTDLFVWNKMVQSSLKWLLGSSRRYKRLTWRSQGQLQFWPRFCSKLQIKKFITHTDTWRILRYKSIINKVSLKLHKASSKTFCLDTVNFFFYSTSDENANSPGQFSPSGHDSKVIYRVPNQYLKWLFSYSNDPSSFKTYWLFLIRFHS